MSDAQICARATLYQGLVFQFVHFILIFYAIGIGFQE